MNTFRNITRTLTFASALVALLLLASGCSKIKMARHEQRADKYFAAGDFSSAELEYRNVLGINHTNAHAIARLGTIYFKQGSPGTAYPYLLKAVQFYPNDLDLRVKLGIVNLAAQKYKEARDDAAFILDHSPTNSEAPRIIAQSVLTSADRDQAQKSLDALSQKIGKTAPLEVAFGELDFRAGDVQAAEAAFKRALTLDPKCTDAYFDLGNLYGSRNKLKEAGDNLKTAANLAEVRSSERLEYATFEISNGQPAEGKRLLEEITKAAPDYVPAWLRQAHIALDEKRLQDCQTLLERALAHDANNYEALLMEGQLYIVQKEADKAVANFQRMSVYYTHSAQVQFNLALAYLVGGDTSKSVNALNQALAIDPNYPDAIITLAQLNIHQNNASSAIASLAGLVRRQPRFYQAHLLLAAAYARQNNLDEASAVYSRAQSFFPKDPQIPMLAGMVFSQQNKLAEARKSFETALALAPRSSSVVEELVNLDITEKKYPAALDLIQRDLGDSTNAAAAHLLLAKVYAARAENTTRTAPAQSFQPKLNDVPAARDDVNQAEAELLKVIDLKPDLTGPYLLLAQLYVEAGKHQVALDRLTGLAAKTNSAPVYMEIGKIQDALTNYPAARDAYEKVLAIDPNFTPALNDLAYLYSERLGQVDKAYPLAERARQLLPGDPSVADTLGWILYRRGDYSRALGLLDESAGKLGTLPEVQFHLGMTHYMLGEEEPARACLQRAAGASRDFPGRQEASRYLAILAVNVKAADSKSIAQLESALRDQPNDPIAASRLTAVYENAGELEKAVKVGEEALKLNSQNAQLMGRLAGLYLRLNDSQKALEMAKQAHQLAPEDAMISWTLGRLVYRSGDFPWALSLLRETSEKLPARNDVLYDLAWSYYSMGTVDNAESAMQKAVPALSGAELNDANCFVAMVSGGTTAPMIQQANQVLATNANYVPAIMVVATQKEQEGKYDDARALYQKALIQYPAFAPAARNIAMLAAQHPGDDQKAFDLGMKARTTFPSDAKLASALGILAYRSGNYSQSAQLLGEGVDNSAKDGELFYYLGKANFQLKQKQKSKDALQRALALNLRSDMADDARKVLAELKQN